MNPHSETWIWAELLRQVRRNEELTLELLQKGGFPLDAEKEK